MMKYIVIAIAVVVLIGLIVFFQRKRKHQEEPDEPSASIALLLAKPFSLDETRIRQALSKGLSADFSVNTDYTFVLPVIEGAQYMAKHEDTMFILHNVPSPYFPSSEIAANAIQGDDALARNVREHQAWLSFDVLGSNRNIGEQYDLIGPVLAELAPEQTVALFVVEKEVLIRFDSDRREQLRGPDTLKKLGFE